MKKKANQTRGALVIQIIRYGVLCVYTDRHILGRRNMVGFGDFLMFLWWEWQKLVVEERAVKVLSHTALWTNWNLAF